MQTIDQISAFENLYRLSYPSVAVVNTTPAEPIQPVNPPNKGMSPLLGFAVIALCAAGFYWYYKTRAIKIKNEQVRYVSGY